MQLAAQHGSTNTDENGQIITLATTVFANSILIAVLQSDASPDKKCRSNNPHCKPRPSTASSTVFANGFLVHRILDKRICGASTNTGCTNVFVGG